MGGGEKKGYDRIVLLSMIENVILGDSFPAYISWLLLRQYGLGEAVRFAANHKEELPTNALLFDALWPIMMKLQYDFDFFYH